MGESLSFAGSLWFKTGDDCRMSFPSDFRTGYCNETASLAGGGRRGAGVNARAQDTSHVLDFSC